MTEPVSGTVNGIAKIFKTAARFFQWRNISKEGEAKAQAMIQEGEAESRTKLLDAETDAKALETRGNARRAEERRDFMNVKFIEALDDVIETGNHQAMKRLISIFSESDGQLEERTLSRVLAQEMRYQLNAENVTVAAAQFFEDDEQVTDKPVNRDWIDSFYDSLRFVSDEEMQLFWAKVLAGEVKKPGSFSRRTLEMLRLLTTEDALIFEALGNLAVRAGQWTFIVRGDYLEEKFKITFQNILALREAGLIMDADGLAQTYGHEGILIYGDRAIYMLATSSFSIPTWGFTKTGLELLRMIKFNPNGEFLTALAFDVKTMTNSDNVEVGVAIGNYFQVDEDNFEITDLQQI